MYTLVKRASQVAETRPYNREEGETAETMARKKKAETDEPFGPRLARLRKAAGYSQRALAAEIGSSQRMVAYYELETTKPPAHLLAAIGDALGVSVDQLLGREAATKGKGPVNQRLLRELRRVEKLPAHARRSVLEHIDGLAAKYRVGA